MNCLNLHNHDINVTVVKEDKSLIEEFCLDKLSESNKITNDSEYFYTFKCNTCKYFNNDYLDNYSLNGIFPFLSGSAPLFCNKNYSEEVKKKLGLSAFKFFEFFKFENHILIGTRNEIILHLRKNYDSLKEKYKYLTSKINGLESTKNNYERSIKKIKGDLENEKNEREKMKNDLNSIRKEKYNLSINLENEKVTNSELNIKMSKLNVEQNSLIKEINDLNQNLNKEKNKNQELNKKLKNIYSKNEENVKIVQERFETEKLKTKNLGSKISELEKKEKEQKLKADELEQSIKLKEQLIQNLTNNNKNLGNNVEELESRLKLKDQEINNIKKNYSPENFGLKFRSDSKIGEYDIVLDITSFKDLINGGWKVKYNREEGKQKYLNKKDEPTIVVGVIGNRDQGKSFFLEKLSGYQIPKGFNVKTEGLNIRYDTS